MITAPEARMLTETLGEVYLAPHARTDATDNLGHLLAVEEAADPADDRAHVEWFASVGEARPPTWERLADLEMTASARKVVYKYLPVEPVSPALSQVIDEASAAGLLDGGRDKLADAIEQMGAALRDNESLTGLTCREADTIATVLAVAGQLDAAAAALMGHAQHDDNSDRHEAMNTDDDAGHGRAAALAYARTLAGG